jgi:hypothetical protein
MRVQRAPPPVAARLLSCLIADVYLRLGQESQMIIDCAHYEDGYRRDEASLSLPEAGARDRCSVGPHPVADFRRILQMIVRVRHGLLDP